MVRLCGTSLKGRVVLIRRLMMRKGNCAGSVRLEEVDEASMECFYTNFIKEIESAQKPFVY